MGRQFELFPDLLFSISGKRYSYPSLFTLLTLLLLSSWHFFSPMAIFWFSFSHFPCSILFSMTSLLYTTQTFFRLFLLFLLFYPSLLSVFSYPFLHAILWPSVHNFFHSSFHVWCPFLCPLASPIFSHFFIKFLFSFFPSIVPSSSFLSSPLRYVLSVFLSKPQQF